MGGFFRFSAIPLEDLPTRPCPQRQAGSVPLTGRSTTTASLRNKPRDTEGMASEIGDEVMVKQYIQ